MAETAPTKARGIRLPVALWDSIDADASALDMSLSELVRRRLATFYASDSRKTGESVRESADGIWGA